MALVGDVEAELAHLVFGRNVGLGALLANPADQALSHQSARRGSHQEWLDPNIDQTGDGAGRVISVQSGEDKVTGQGCIDRDCGGFQVANFADHNHVGRLPKNRAQGRGK